MQNKPTSTLKLNCSHDENVRLLLTMVVCLCAVKWRRLVSSLIHWYSEGEIIKYYFPNSVKDDVWPCVHTCRRGAAGWSQMRQRALRRAGGEKISHHANDLRHWVHLRWPWSTAGDGRPIRASYVNTVVRDRLPHHINIQLCLQEMID